ncbi:lytic transglycosylase domain-containing protein [Dictyobacter aurantiacus]|uniref:Transglycosylase SLT domain-containing protein n=1 Tax=Dictyobacter aurantiacus TaxID=1936993 RepID=A0A401ZHI3_9CHLR|nr:lytic transglycosylase domain-containing protein [Dictyobacter aurantiacus]GCE06344.1 hypothetical protein KDAU_36730 [Dictyobacter aurantiacus]
MMSLLRDWGLYAVVILVAALAVLVTNRPGNPRVCRILARNVFLLSLFLCFYHLFAVTFLVKVPALADTSGAVLIQHPLSAGSVNYVSLARQDAVAAGIDPDLFVRQINQESGFQPGVVSSAGAVGIAQFMPATAAGLGIDPHDPVQALHAAARLMASYLRQYGSESAALAAYNAGPAALKNARMQCGARWQSCLPAETQHYIAVILG